MDEECGYLSVKSERKIRGRMVKVFTVRVRNIVIVRGLLVPLQIISHQILGHSSARDQVRR